MSGILSIASVGASVRYSDELNLLYLNNPKVACSTIKYTLWKAIDRLNGGETYAGTIHKRGDDPFVKNIFAKGVLDPSSFRNAVVFSVVRNPFVRVLSAYLDKVGRDHAVWGPFSEHFGLKPGVKQVHLTFPDFLRLIAGEPDELLNVHFCSQRRNLLLPFSKPAFVGRLEAMDEVARFLENVGAPMEDFRPHAKNAGERVAAYYDSECADIVREMYAEDFRIFGYSPSLNEFADFKRTISIEGTKDFLIDWILTRHHPVDLYDSAQKSFHQFSTTRSAEEKLEHIQRSFETDDNWMRLHVYAEFAQKAKRPTLRKNILDRINVLRSRRFDKVENKSVFLQASLG